jgi:methionyl-tRNA formyltransferase
VVAVVTNPDRAAGRGRKLRPPPIRTAAEALGLPVLQPASPREESLPDRLRQLRPDVFAVVAFSILPKRLLAVPRLGSVNVHPSLLPAYRGAAPIVWALFDGCAETGISTFLLNPRVDAGDILLQERVAIDREETAGELEARLAIDGARLLVRSLDGLEDGTVVPTPQPTRGLSRAPKLARDDGRLDWSWPVEQVRNRVRGANPIPGAFTEWSRGLLKVHRAVAAAPAESPSSPGEVLRADDRDGLVVACGDGGLRLTEVQPAGRPRMSGEAFARGYPVAAGDRFGVDDEPAEA